MKPAQKGNPGYAKVAYIGEQVGRLSERWFELTEQWLNGKNKSYQKLAYVELGKLIGKSMPTAITGEDGGPVEFIVKHYGSTKGQTSANTV